MDSKSEKLLVFVKWVKSRISDFGRHAGSAHKIQNRSLVGAPDPCFRLTDGMSREQNKDSDMRKWFCLLAVLFSLLFDLPCFGQAQQTEQPGSAQRVPFSDSEQEAYFDGLIRNAPKAWQHGKNWVRIEPYVIGRYVTQPVARIVCPDPTLATPLSDGTEIPPWVYSSPQVCGELAAAHDSALIVLEDRNDNDAGYFIFLACDKKRSRNHCDVEPYGEQNGMKLEESNKGGRPQFDVLAPTSDNLSDRTKISRFFVAEVWHMHKAAPEPSAK